MDGPLRSWLTAPPRRLHSCYLWVRKGWIPACTVFVSLSFSWNSTLCLPQERESPLARSSLSHKASKQEKWAGHSFTLVSSAWPASAQNRLSHSLTFTCVMMKQFLENLVPLLSLWFNLCIQNFIPFLVLHLFPLKTGEHQRKRGTNWAGLYGTSWARLSPPRYPSSSYLQDNFNLLSFLWVPKNKFNQINEKNQTKRKTSKIRS